MRARISLPLVLLCSALALADNPPPTPGLPGSPEAGHSAHGDTFDEGPRQAAVLMKGMGAVSFTITTQSDDAQKFFDQGVAQLHGFWYYEAERSFRQAAKFDPGAPMPYWGMAMANVNNDKRAGEFMKQAVSRREKASPREKLYLDAYGAFFSPGKKGGDADKARRTALVKALEKIVFEFPDDIEAKAFLVFHVWDNSENGMPISSRAALASLAGEVLAKNPLHPGAHHYLIHLWNHDDDRRALQSAAVNGQAAPGIAHLWHMPGHTFTALRRYADAAWQQEASARTDHAYMAAARLMPEQIHNYAHNNDWLVENLGFTGRVHDALALAKNMIELPRLGPGHQRIGRGGNSDERTGFVMGRKRLADLLLAWELWDDLLALDGGGYLPASEDPAQEARRLMATGAAAFQKGDTARGEAKIAALRAMLDKVTTERDAKIAETEARPNRKKEKQAGKEGADAGAAFKPKIEPLQKAIAELEFFRALNEGCRRLEKLARGEKPDDGDDGDPLAPALKQIGAVTGVSKLRLSRLHDLAGDSAKAAQLAREAVKEGGGQVLPLANLAGILWRKGDRQEALDTFQKLRPLCAQADLDMPALARMTPIATELGLPPDWRPKLEWAADTGERPDLASLGPFRWQPYESPGWSLADQDGTTRSLADFKGRPVLMIFYLGSGCSHCIEQLNIFGPMTKEFSDAGIQIVAVSTEKAEELFKTFALAKDSEGFPFPILADPALDVFKAFRAFDDFETMPLHGTFLIDSAGLVRWQDISFKPFTQAKWLLDESKRLLALPGEAKQKAVTASQADPKP